MSGGAGRAIRIGTRASELAIRQARLVQTALADRGIAAELVTFKTTGDTRLDEPLSEIGAKGLFTKELEVALGRRKVDCCVHSLKDLPTDAPEGLAVVALLERADPRDVVVLNPVADATGLHDLPRGSRVGTSSLRRRAQLLAWRPDLEVVELRGNVPTRLRKVDDGQVLAAILAAAGLHRLEVTGRIASYLEPPDWLPAPGQGAVAVQARADDDAVRELMAPLDHPATAMATGAERAFLAALDGGCQVPIGALCQQTTGGEAAVRHTLFGMIADVRGRRVVRGEAPVDPERPERSGKALADDLRERGGGMILASLRDAGAVPAPQPE